MSLKEIAKRANVSIGTVDRVIHNRGRVALKTKQNVLRIIKEINYQPNIYARNLSLSKIYKLGIILPKLSQESHFWRLHKRGIEKALKELQIHKVQADFYYFDRYSESSLEKSFRVMNGENLDGIIMAPLMEKKTKEIIEKLNKNIPYVFIDSDIPGSNYLTCISQDSYQSGVVAAKLMSLIVDKNDSIAIIKVLPDDFHINERINGFTTFIKNKKIKTFYFEVNSKNLEEFKSIVTNILHKCKKLSGVFVSNVWVHEVARNLKELSPSRKITVIGYDLVNENIQQLKNNNIDFIISQRPELQGHESIYSLYRKLVLKEKVDKKIRIPLDIITKENFMYYKDFFNLR